MYIREVLAISNDSKQIQVKYTIQESGVVYRIQWENNPDYKVLCHWACTGCNSCGSAGHGNSWF